MHADSFIPSQHTTSQKFNEQKNNDFKWASAYKSKRWIEEGTQTQWMSLQCYLSGMRSVWLHIWHCAEQAKSWAGHVGSKFCVDGVVLMPSKYHKSDLRAVGWISQYNFSRVAARALMITAISRLVRLTDGVHFIFNLITQVPLMLTHQYFYNSKNSFHVIIMLHCYKCYVRQNKSDKSTSTF